MRFSPSFLEDLRTRVALSDVVGRKVTWDKRKSKPAQGDHWAPCPFHHEKTASFHADDARGFYHCFGCGASGDLFKFVMETENLPFAEAVARVAADAGVALPEPEGGNAAARAAEDKRQRLFAVMEEAVRFFRQSLQSSAGAGARAYLEHRGLGAETIARFELGYAPGGRSAGGGGPRLTDRLRDKGALEDGIEAGLATVPREDRGRGMEPYDFFRNRLMFPIRDGRGRCIAFGARALAEGQEPKYLNSSDTPLFSKGRNLYHFGPARGAAGKAGTLIVAEGYMDVIALAQAGFDHAVAPLGTAVKADQLQLLWKATDEPVIALDGDRAGLDAAFRLIDHALPLLAPGKSLRFCVMPGGQDPDDVIRAGGTAAMAEVLAGAVPLVEMLWRRETAAAPLDTPERRAAFDKRLDAQLGKIADPAVRAHYRDDLRERRRALFRRQPPPGTPAGPGPAVGLGQGRGAAWAPAHGSRAGGRAAQMC
ncbi:MAG: DNA primase [Pseudomonadota bacterium]